MRRVTGCSGSRGLPGRPSPRNTGDSGYLVRLRPPRRAGLPCGVERVHRLDLPWEIALTSLDLAELLRLAFRWRDLAELAAETYQRFLEHASQVSKRAQFHCRRASIENLILHYLDVGTLVLQKGE